MRASWIAATLIVSSHVLTARPQATVPTVYTAAQASAGRRAYLASCASCHMPDLSGSNDVPPLAGPVFLSTWRTRTTTDLFDYLSASMPPGASPLNTETYESIVAFMLETNDAPAGTRPFTSRDASPLRDILGGRM